MKRIDFLKSMTSPLPNAVLKKFPKGNIMQYWGENPQLYSLSYHYDDDIHRYLGGHSGVDISTKQRDPVYAAHAGTVIAAGGQKSDAGGIVVQIQSSPLDDEETANSKVQTNYLHLDECIVHIGDTVSQGQQIGYEGNSGFVISGMTEYWGNAPAGVGTHLHFSLFELKRIGTVWVPRYVNAMGNTSDPLYYLTGDTGGEVTVLQNILAFLKKWTGR